MTLLDILNGTAPPEVKNARLVSFEPTQLKPEAIKKMKDAQREHWRKNGRIGRPRK